jgi:hypothetical protein
VHVEDIQAAYDAALAAGAESVNPPETVMEGVRIAMVRAPGGVLIGFSGPRNSAARAPGHCSESNIRLAGVHCRVDSSATSLYGRPSATSRAVDSEDARIRLVHAVANAASAVCDYLGLDEADVPSDQRGCREPKGDHDDRDHERGAVVRDQEGERVQDAAEERPRAGNRAAEERGCRGRSGRGVWQRLAEGHADTGADSGRQPATNV